MVTPAGRFTFSGTVLEREDLPPLVAVALYAPDGRLHHAAVVDPAYGPVADTEALTDGLQRMPGNFNGGAM